MAIAVLILGTILLIPAARLEGRHKLWRAPIIGFVALVQVAYLVYYLMTLERPPLQ